MNAIIERFKEVIIQIATPYSTGTGFYLKDVNLIITNEHVVRDNKEVIIDGMHLERQLSKVLYTDQKYDLAFLEISNGEKMPLIELDLDQKITAGDIVIAMGHPFGLKFTATQGIVSNALHQVDHIDYYQHDAALNPGNSGGPLVNENGSIIGINTFVIRDGNNIGFSLPVKYLNNTLQEYQSSKAAIAVRCPSCSNLVFENQIDKKYCPHCGSFIQLPSQIEEYEAVGIAKTIEVILEKAGHPIKLSRRGPNNWELRQGSAKISIAYYEKNGLITGDAYLCHLPKQNIQALYEYLLKQNYLMEGLTFSVKGQDIIISLLIYDRYLNEDTCLKLFTHLFEKADHYDDILVDEFGATWKTEEE